MWNALTREFPLCSSRALNITKILGQLTLTHIDIIERRILASSNGTSIFGHTFTIPRIHRLPRRTPQQTNRGYLLLTTTKNNIQFKAPLTKINFSISIRNKKRRLDNRHTLTGRFKSFSRRAKKKA